jgi:hypothetical protein
MNTPSDIATAKTISSQVKNQTNPVIPEELSTLEDKLKEEGSSTSTLGHVMAWLGAAKGDFRGLQSIEESKRRTALAKSIVPEINKVNTLTNAGKWEEASDYVNKLVGSYGARADYLVPYFTAMQAKISQKQEGWNNLVGLQKMMEAGGAGDPENINNAAFNALSAAIKDKTPISETNLQGFMTRYGAPHLQNIDNRLTATSPLTQKTRTEILPGVVKVSDMTNFAGNTVASGNNLNTKQLADLHNNIEVTNDKGDVIKPNSKEARAIKAQFNALQPINARLEMAALAQIPPEVAVRLLEEQGLLRVATRDFGKANVIQNAYDAIREEDTKKQIAINTGTMASDPRALPQGKLPFDLDTFSEVKTPVTPDEVKKSKGRIILLRPEVINNQIKPALAEIENLLLIPGMFEDKTPQTTGDRLATGAQQYLSSWLGFPLGKEVETRQRVKTMLRRAIETVENTPEIGAQITGKDSTDLKDLKAYAAGDFKTPLELIRAADTVTQRLQQVLRRAVGGMEETEVTVTPKGTATTPAEVLAPVISKAKKPAPQQSQITRDPYGPGGIQIPPDIEEGIRKAVEATGKAAKASGKPTTGSTRIELPTSTAPQSGQPTGQPQQKQQGYSEEDEVQRAMKQKRIQRGMK